MGVFLWSCLFLFFVTSDLVIISTEKIRDEYFRHVTKIRQKWESTPLHQACPKLHKRQNGPHLAYNAVRSGCEPHLCVIIMLCSHLLCVVIIMFPYVLICFASAIDTIWRQCWLCAEMFVFLYFGTVYLCWGFRSHQPDFMMLKNSFVFMCIGTYLFYSVLGCGLVWAVSFGLGASSFSFVGR